MFRACQNFGLAVAALSATAMSTAAQAAFVSAPASVVDQLKASVGGPVRILVAGAGADGKEAEAALRDTLAGKDGIALVMGSEALGDLSGLDDHKVFRRARRMPIDYVAVVRLYPQGDGRPAMAVVPVYDRDGKTVVTLTFEAMTKEGVAAPPPPKAPPLARPESEGLAPKAAPAPTSSTTQSPHRTAPESKRYSVLVLDPVETDIDPDIRVAVSGKMAAELSTVRRFDVLTAADIRAMTALEANRQLAGCDDESCMAEIADALGADLVVSWDISRIGSKRIITVRFFDARTSKSVGRAQAEADDDEELASKAGVALRDAIDIFLRKILDGSTSRREEYAANILSVEPKGLLGTGRTYMRGKDRVPVEMAEFYREAGMAEEADDIESAQALATVMTTGGAVTAGAGVLLFIGGIVGIGLGFGFPPIAVVGGGALVSSIVVIVAAMASIVVGAILAPQPRPLAEEQSMANDHNRRLRRKLGLPESASLFDRVVGPAKPMLATLSSATNVE